MAVCAATGLCEELSVVSGGNGRLVCDNAPTLVVGAAAPCAFLPSVPCGILPSAAVLALASAVSCCWTRVWIRLKSASGMVCIPLIRCLAIIRRVSKEPVPRGIPHRLAVALMSSTVACST